MDRGPCGESWLVLLHRCDVDGDAGRARCDNHQAGAIPSRLKREADSDRRWPVDHCSLGERHVDHVRAQGVPGAGRCVDDDGDETEQDVEDDDPAANVM